MDLFGNSKELLKHERVDTATVYKDFQQSMIDKAVSPEGRRRAAAAETQTLFDCTIDELYEGTGGKKGVSEAPPTEVRSSLPKEAQKAYMVNEVISTNRIKESQFGGNQKHRDDQVVETVQETAQQTRKWFPW